jgi:epoxyqueuosine reductase
MQPIQIANAIGESGSLNLVELLSLSEQEFLSRFQGTSIMRAKRIGMQKNACVALGNRREESAVPALSAALTSNESLVRGHAAWALGQIANPEAIKALEQSYEDETDQYVRSELTAALDIVALKKHL